MVAGVARDARPRKPYMYTQTGYKRSWGAQRFPCSRRIRSPTKGQSKIFMISQHFGSASKRKPLSLHSRRCLPNGTRRSTRRAAARLRGFHALEEWPSRARLYILLPGCAPPPWSRRSGRPPPVDSSSSGGARSPHPPWAAARCGTWRSLGGEGGFN